jgi:hypothetical protein
VLGTGSAAAGPSDTPISLPSGHAAVAMEYRADTDAQGPLLRARYLVATLDGGEDSDAVFADMTYLCETDAFATWDVPPPRVVVSLSSRSIDFGTIDADVVQYFEAFRVEDRRCIWELF